MFGTADCLLNERYTALGAGLPKGLALLTLGIESHLSPVFGA
jgi:hypothetical protein